VCLLARISRLSGPTRGGAPLSFSLSPISLVSRILMVPNLIILHMETLPRDGRAEGARNHPGIRFMVVSVQFRWSMAKQDGGGAESR
jgi:hypothetical protein